MRRVEFHPEAEDELISAGRFYEDQTTGLGLEFIRTIQGTYERLRASPRSGTPFGRQLRRVLVPKFPYGLLYRVEPERIYIVAACTSVGGRGTGGTGSEALPNNRLERAGCAGRSA